MISLILLVPLLVVTSSPVTQVGSANQAVLINEHAKSNLLVATATALTKSTLNKKKRMPQRRVALGTWGGDHIRMSVTTKGATIEYDCALGSVVGRLTLDTKGRFSASGTLTREGPGPVRLGALQSSRPVRYEGRVAGDQMSLTVTLIEQSEDVGSFILRRGSEGRLRKCR